MRPQHAGDQAKRSQLMIDGSNHSDVRPRRSVVDALHPIQETLTYSALSILSGWLLSGFRTPNARAISLVMMPPALSLFRTMVLKKVFASPRAIPLSML
jgi:hypothetical protein